MCHGAIKDHPTVHRPDKGNQASCTGNCEPHNKMEVKIEPLLKNGEGDDVTYNINTTSKKEGK